MPSTPTGPARLVVLVSGSGTLLQALLEASADPAYGARVVAVGADRHGIAGLDRAAAYELPTFAHPYAKGSDRSSWDSQLTDLVAAHEPDLVISAGFMKLLGPVFLDHFGGRVINTHPALLPSFPGMHGPRDALAYGVKVTGASVFLVDSGVDTGHHPRPGGGRGGRRRHGGEPARADQGRRAATAGGDHPPVGHPQLAGRRPPGAMDLRPDDPRSSDRTDQ